MFGLIAFCLLLLGVAGAALAQPASLPDDPASIISWLKETHSGGHWALLVGGVLTLVVRFATALGPLADRLPPESRKWVAMGAAVLGGMGTGLMAGMGWFKSATDGVLLGLAAVGGWEVFLKKLFPPKTSTP